MLHDWLLLLMMVLSLSSCYSDKIITSIGGTYDCRLLLSLEIIGVSILNYIIISAVVGANQDIIANLRIYWCATSTTYLLTIILHSRRWSQSIILQWTTTTHTAIIMIILSVIGLWVILDWIIINKLVGSN